MFGIFQSNLEFLDLIPESFNSLIFVLIFHFLILYFSLKVDDFSFQFFFLLFKDIFNSLKLLLIYFSGITFLLFSKFCDIFPHFFMTFYQLSTLILPFHQFFFKIFDFFLFIPNDIS